MTNIFNVRVYGLIIKDESVLVCTERYSKIVMTKFPGGGLEFGEGTVDCLIRECKEELQIELGSIEHFYTTDFFQVSAFNSQQQLISIYYTAKLKEDDAYPVGKQALNEHAELIAYWMPIAKLDVDDFTFPVDKKVVEMLRGDRDWL